MFLSTRQIQPNNVEYIRPSLAEGFLVSNPLDDKTGRKFQSKKRETKKKCRHLVYLSPAYFGFLC